MERNAWRCEILLLIWGEIINLIYKLEYYKRNNLRMLLSYFFSLIYYTPCSPGNI